MQQQFKSYHVMSCIVQCTGESNLDHGTRRRYSESNIQTNRVSTNNTTSIITASTNGQALPHIVPSKSTKGSGQKSDPKLEQKATSIQSLDKVERTGEASFLDGIPKPALIIGKLLTEFHRSQSASSLEIDSYSMQTKGSGHDNLSIKRHARGRSVEPLENKRTNNVTVTRSSSMRHETTTRSKFKAINILSRRKVADSKLANPTNQNSGVKVVRRTPSPSTRDISLPPKVTSPHPVRRNMATSTCHLSKSKQHHSVVKVQPRPRAITISTSDSCKHSEETGIQLRQGSIKKRKCTPPEKPPRTLSTFFSSDEQDDLFRQLDSVTVQDVVKGGVTDVALTTIELPSNSSIQPPTHLHTALTNYTQAQPQPSIPSVGGKQPPQSSLPLGHSGDYAEVFSRSASIPSGSESLNLSTESNYDVLKDPSQLSASPEALIPLSTPQATNTHFALPLPSAQPHTPQLSYRHTSDSSDPYYSLPCVSPKVSPETLIPLSTPPASHPHFTLPLPSAQPHSPQLSHPHTSDSSDPYYSLPCVSPTEVRTTESEAQISIPVQSPTHMVTQLNSQLQHIMTSTLETLCQQELDKMTCRESLLKTVWKDLELKSETEARFKGVDLSIKVRNL